MIQPRQALNDADALRLPNEETIAELFELDGRDGWFEAIASWPEQTSEGNHWPQDGSGFNDWVDGAWNEGLGDGKVASKGEEQTWLGSLLQWERLGELALTSEQKTKVCRRVAPTAVKSFCAVELNASFFM